MFYKDDTNKSDYKVNPYYRPQKLERHLVAYYHK